MVDDAPDSLALMSGLLKGDYNVKIANAGEKALKIAVSDSPPDLILLNIMMPGMDGYEAIWHEQTGETLTWTIYRRMIASCHHSQPVGIAPTRLEKSSGMSWSYVFHI